MNLDEITRIDIEGELRDWLSGAQRVVIAGIGNSLRKDDYAGARIARNLMGRTPPSVYPIECETVPEDFLEPIVRFNPTHILIVDTAWLNLKPGSPKLIEPNQLGGHAISTHVLPLRIFCDFLDGMTGAKIALFSIQPKDTGLGEGLTAELEAAVKSLSDILVKILSEVLGSREVQLPETEAHGEEKIKTPPEDAKI
jgi:hydrogenase 3 maturation protease